MEDELTEQLTKGMSLSYLETLKQMFSKIAWATSLDEYRQKTSKIHYDWRKSCFYVEYDWEKKRWIEPLKHEITAGILVDKIQCNFNMTRARNPSQSLARNLEEDSKK